MPRYGVTWYIEVTAETPEEAAKQAAEEERLALHAVNLATGKSRCIFLVPLEGAEE